MRCVHYLLPALASCQVPFQVIRALVCTCLHRGASFMRRAFCSTTRQLSRPWQHKRGVSTKPHYVSTPIFYVNAGTFCLSSLGGCYELLTGLWPVVPHVGHLYTSVIGDIIHRYAGLRNPGGSTFLNTGTDEHGLKIQKAAQAAGSDPKAFTDHISRRFKVSS